MKITYCLLQACQQLFKQSHTCSSFRHWPQRSQKTLKKNLTDFLKMSSSEKKVLVILSPGAEEMETVISTDVLRRAKINVILAGLDSADPVECSRKVCIVPDMSLDDAVTKGPFDVVVLPGGLGGSKRLAASAKVKQVLQSQEASGNIVAAVCAAPSALLAHGIAKVGLHSCLCVFVCVCVCECVCGSVCV